MKCVYTWRFCIIALVIFLSPPPISYLIDNKQIILAQDSKEEGSEEEEGEEEEINTIPVEDEPTPIKPQKKSDEEKTIDQQIQDKVQEIKDKYGVDVHFDFPQDIVKCTGWDLKANEINNSSSPEVKAATLNSLNTLDQNLSNYPKDFLERELKDVYLAQGMTLDNGEIGGIYPSNCGPNSMIIDINHPDPYNHEFNHNLYMKYRDTFPTKEWDAITPPNSYYNLRKYENCSERPAGFASCYGATNRWDDIAEVARLTFSNDPNNQAIINSDSLLKAKSDLLKQWYQKIYALPANYVKRIKL